MSTRPLRAKSSSMRLRTRASGDWRPRESACRALACERMALPSTETTWRNSTRSRDSDSLRMPTLYSETINRVCSRGWGTTAALWPTRGWKREGGIQLRCSSVSCETALTMFCWKTAASSETRARTGASDAGGWPGWPVGGWAGDSTEPASHNAGTAASHRSTFLLYPNTRICKRLRVQRKNPASARSFFCASPLRTRRGVWYPEQVADFGILRNRLLLWFVTGG